VIAGVEDGTWKKRTNENGRKEQTVLATQKVMGEYISSLATY